MPLSLRSRRQLTVDHKAQCGRADGPGSAVSGAAVWERRRLEALGAQLSADGYLQVGARQGVWERGERLPPVLKLYIWQAGGQ